MGVITSESRSTIERMERRLLLQKEASDRLIAALTLRVFGKQSKAKEVMDV